MIIRVINLTTAKERKCQVESEIQCLNLRAEFMSAFWHNCPVGNPELSTQELRLAYLFKSYFGHLSLTGPEIGCSTSHVQALREFLESEEEWGCVFEDDVIVKDSELLQLIINQPAPFVQDADFMYLGAFRNTTPLNYRQRAKFGIKSFFKLIGVALRVHRDPMGSALHFYQSISENFSPAGIRHSEHFNLSGLHDGAHAYVLNRKAASWLLHWNANCLFSADEALRFMSFCGEIKMIVPKNNIVIQKSDLPSQIGNNPKIREQ